ncbi:hypothetical protein TNCV_3454581 [Trichonephila clavipes]|nr:hypothetical protein TNCV_3454581 [Trichonephila clavipes]
MGFTEINSRGKRGEFLGRIDRQNSRFRTAKTTRRKFGLHDSFVELESSKNAVNETGNLLFCAGGGNDGDSPLPLALLMEATTGVGMSRSPLVEATEIPNACLLTIGLLVGYRDKSQ